MVKKEHLALVKDDYVAFISEMKNGKSTSILLQGFKK